MIMEKEMHKEQAMSLLSGKIAESNTYQIKISSSTSC